MLSRQFDSSMSTGRFSVDPLLKKTAADVTKQNKKINKKRDADGERQ